ncbi:transposase family protein [Streptomyces sp. NPDC056831]|uniref:transposase family protein n=1 Tax=Streptomyces sp. NPDC056831 TaxID=3345954 RepID=UPI0036C63FBE
MVHLRRRGEHTGEERGRLGGAGRSLHHDIRNRTAGCHITGSGRALPCRVREQRRVPSPRLGPQCVGRSAVALRVDVQQGPADGDHPGAGCGPSHYAPGGVPVGVVAQRADHVLAHLRAAGLGVLADLGFRGLENDVRDPVIVTGFTATRAHKLTPGQKDANRVLATGRAPAEHGFAHLKNWRTLTKLRTDPARATHLLRARAMLRTCGSVRGGTRRAYLPE